MKSHELSEGRARRGRLQTALLVAVWAVACNGADFSEAEAEPEAEPEAHCLPDGGTDPGDAGDKDDVFVEVGIPDEDTRLTFVPLEEDGEILVERGSQGGSHALLAVQSKGLGNRVYFSVTVKDTVAGGKVTLPELPNSRPIACDSDGLCKLTPLTVPLGGFAPPDTWEGLRVQVTATLRNEDGLSETGKAFGVLHELNNDP